ncbi:RHS repeat-associated core domain-containing protein [Leifsonia sp. NPDC056665]|uniref:RHS repeat domain-containing protein n=1 Tax=Leifsonia sp. NPDC056665 TaxID=3345901 RepID=UPI003683A981
MTTRSAGRDVASTTGAWQPVGDTGLAVAPTTIEPGPLVAQTKGAISSSTDKVRVSIVDSATAKKRGLSGFTLSVARDDLGTTGARVAIRIPKKELDSVYGADYSSRLVWSQVAASGGKARTAVPATADAATGSVVITPMISAAPMMVAAAAAPVSSSGTGSFAATSLKPSSSWDVSAQTGDFSWSYPLAVPPTPAGPSPSVALAYDSQSVDGETGSTNNQPSAIGEGWSLAGGGFIERSYVPCAIDNGASGPVTTSGDECWKTDNATISVGGHSGQLIKDATTGVWKLQSDDGTRFEHLVGSAAGCSSNGTYDTDCWRMTTTDGTQYYFGLNQLPGWASGKPTTNSTWTVPVYGNDPGEPCHNSTFATSSCVQAWRWNLDYVVDVHGNAEAYYYDTQTNLYSANGTTATSYVRGGELDHIDYGFTTGNAYATNAASGRIVFGYDAYGRCSDTTHANCTAESISGNAAAAAHPTSYPDVPFDQNCTTGTCAGLLSPTFWSTAMLSTVTTKALVSGAYANVDVWTLGHSFPSPGDTTNAALWLTQVAHTGYQGTTTATEPPTVFSGVAMQNRVWVIDGLAPLDKYRVTTIQSALGAKIQVGYSAQQCTPSSAAAIEANPQTNTNRCFPQWWTPQVTPPQPAQEDLFHKYVVTTVTTNPETGGAYDQTQETDYSYGTPAWRYDSSPLIPDSKRTWSVFAGYNTVEVQVGDHNTPSAQAVTDYTFYQGMDGDRAAPSGGTKSVLVTGSTSRPDSRWFAGTVREQKTVGGVGGSTLSDTVTTPWASDTTANDGTLTARMTGSGDVFQTQPTSTNGTRSTDTTTTYDGTTGLPITVSTVPSDAIPSCTTTSYAPSNSAAWIIGKPAKVVTVDLPCGTNANYPDDVISDVRTTYDGGTWNTAPTKGDPTLVERAKAFTGNTESAATWIPTTTTTYDAFGRVASVKDALGHLSSNTYTPAATAGAGSGGTTSVATTNQAPFNWTTTTTFDPARGTELSATDANAKVTTATYDPLGRRIGVWLPTRPQASNPTSPSIGYSYTLSQTAASAVTTNTVNGGGTATTYALYDGLGQEIQTQTHAEGGGTDVADTAYDSQGRVAFTDNTYWTVSANPSTTLFVPTSLSQIGSQTAKTYDAFGRTITVATNSYGNERFHTSTAYLGADRVETTPPAGGTPTATITNSMGQQTSLTEYLAATPGGAASAETTTYGYNKVGKMAQMVDPAGNTWSWQFDLLGRQVSATDPDTGTTTSTYDDGGNLLTTTDARGTTLAYTYDNLNRKTGEFTGSASGAKLAAWTYDTVAKGQLTSSTSYVGSTPGVPGAPYSTTITGYDSLYDVTGSTISLPASAPGFGATSYAYSATFTSDGSPSTRTIPAMGGLPSERMREVYDADGRSGGVTGSAVYASVSYTAIGQLGQIIRSSTTGLYTTFGYDAATGAVNDINDTTALNGNGTLQADRAYTRDDSGDVTKLATSGAAGADTQCFGYDYLHDLTQAWTPTTGDCTATPTATGIGGAAPYWTSYTIDPATGNRTGVTQNPTNATGTATTDTYSYPSGGSPNPHAVQSVTHSSSGTTDSYGYDADGNTTTRPGQTLTYDPTGELSAVTVGLNAQTSIYDPSGNLLLQSDPTNGSTLYLGETELHVASGSTAVTAVRTYSFQGTPVAERSTVAGVTGSTVTWASGDANRTQDLEVNPSSGAVMRRYVDPYGNTRGAAATWTSGHGYLNAPTNALAGLTQLGARAYDAGLGRFLSVDPILSPRNPQQTNGYAYSANNPITDSDATGACYQTSSDSLNFHTNCVGSVGSAAGNGAAYVAHSGPQIAGNSSSDYSAYRLITGPATTIAGLNFKLQQAQALLQAEMDIAIQKLAPQISSYLAMRQGLEANLTSTGLGLAGIGGAFSSEDNAEPASDAVATEDEEELALQAQNEGSAAATTLRLGASTEAVEVAATVPVSKFSDYIFKEGASHGKDAVFRSYGYGSDDSQSLATLYEQQAATKFAAGDYTLGKADQYGQRINISITLRGQGAAAGRSTELVSGWMIRGDGSITLNTPFSGFAK